MKTLGASYKRHHSIVSPLFRRNKLNAYLDTIVDCTDKLLTRWRTYNNDPTQIHLNMIEQSQQLLLFIFGYVAFDYDLQTLEDEYNSNKNELTHALYIYLDAALTCVQLPTIIGRIYLLLNLKYRRARSTINRYLQRMIEQELRETPQMRAERKRTSLIASLVESLQQDEKLEEKKLEETKKGR
jgi:cytochrome P450